MELRLETFGWTDNGKGRHHTTEMVEIRILGTSYEYKIKLTAVTPQVKPLRVAHEAMMTQPYPPSGGGASCCSSSLEPGESPGFGAPIESIAFKHRVACIGKPLGGMIDIAVVLARRAIVAALNITMLENLLQE